MLKRFCGVLLSVLCCDALATQEFIDPASKTMTPGRTVIAPLIDGLVEEDEWAAADTIDDFHQVKPVEYSAPSEATRVKVMYDEDALYVAAFLHEQDPQQITANVLRQGDAIRWDDRFEVIVDTFNDRRNGYVFMVNANGVRRQGLFQNTSNMNLDWKGIWQARTGRNAQGWVAEMRIPLKTIAFDPSSDAWGINFQREIVRRAETLGWSSRHSQVNPGTAGTAHGLRGLTQGIGLDVVPSVSMRRREDFDFGDAEYEMEPSMEVFYRPAPTLTAALTFNTDFSGAEVDERQVNLTRFGLFFPEKRAFFLEGADIFEFARLDGSNDEDSALPTESRQNGRPFFSRQIGLSATGQPVDIIAGAKLTGRIGPWNVGILDVQQDSYGGVDEQNLLVGRAALNVLEESSLGAIVTHGNPHSNASNALAGVDFRYRNSRLTGGNLFEAEAWYQRSDTEGADADQDAYGARLRLPNATGWRGGVGAKTIQENFNPALGFVNRRGIRDLTAEVGYTHIFSGGLLQKMYGGVDAQRIDLLHGELESQLVVLRPLELTTQTGDLLTLRSHLATEVLFETFEIAPGVFIPAGRYEFDEHEASIEFSGHRLLSGSLVAAAGEFYDGERTRLEGSATWRPSPHFALVGSYLINDVDLRGGSFISRLARLRVDTVFSATFAWTNFIQYDNLSESVGINSRLHWIPEAGREAFFVVNYGFEDFDRDNRFRSTQSDVVLKLGYTFRF